ncbi:Leucine-rich repeat [Dillenia turbinata]|uniref:Leucine-rich repeat n=1 Tax=Dillenia turbinata TaxID=194707 RepID=A0AAN8W7A9_9MAGN
MYCAAVRFSFFLFSLSLLPLSLLSLSDYDALLALKSSFSPNPNVDSWVSSSSPCKDKWTGIICTRGIISGIRLGNLNLSGKLDFEVLKDLHGLRTISFINNSFTGPIPEFNKLTSLRTVYMSGNQFSGEIPQDFFAQMGSLKKLWLSDNNFTGQIPESLTRLPYLTELHLENNNFSGQIPSFTQHSLTEIDLSNNDLEGEVPASMSKFPASAFSGNQMLCGGQLGTPCKSTAVMESGVDPSAAEKTSNAEDNKANNMLTIIIVAVFTVIILLAMFIKSRTRQDFDLLEKERMPEENVEVKVVAPASASSVHNKKPADSSLRKGNGSRRGGGSQSGTPAMIDLVVVNEEKGVFGMQDLMKATAEVLGNGGLGSAYKAVMATGVSVVVKRMREMNKLGREGFDAEIRRIGQLKHRNILTPLAYHYRKEEKLVVSEYVPRGSLLYLLHGDHGSSRPELNWPTRLKIIKGIVRGLNFLHEEYANSELPHGNLKSSNILLDEDFEPRLNDYAFYPLINTTSAPQGLFGLKSPEWVQHQIVSPKCDVYCLGIVILEIITSKFPSQYLNNSKGGVDVVQWVHSAIAEKREEELIDPEMANATNSHTEMIKLLHIGAACTESNPENRIDLKEAIRRIENL